ncbi:hypothetical protein [Verrucosispora sp. NA02020]|uniref:hypothetical protein n=1 Tax=Verrucosispora sp. NA02020 TaxID=2742132 RepID=UPI0020CA41D1|nr:hypothetical protein [Verrucosispora sp. NA02020]
MTRDWYAWHDQYADPASPLSRRLAEVRTRVGAALDEARPGRLRAVSLCAGQGRDVIPVLAAHPRGADVTARLVELDPRNVEVARAAVARAGLSGVEVVRGDAARTDAYAGMVPADLVLACGVFGNITESDVRSNSPTAAERGDDVRVHRAADRGRRPLTGHGGRIAAVGATGDARPGGDGRISRRSRSRRGGRCPASPAPRR